MRLNSRIGRGLVVAAGTSAVVVALGACSSNSNSSSSSSPTPTQSTSSATSSPTSSGASCTTESIQSAIPNGAKVVSFNCGNAGGAEIAAVKFNPGPTVLFLETKNGKWEVINPDRICGAASAGLPAKVLAYCTAASPSKSASASASKS
ncbi:MAG TPA: hypothetical protein DCQ04_05025 [Actinobacteria bacterium]|nr:hypothetical protein [Actinomycetota bacterium]